MTGTVLLGVLLFLLLFHVKKIEVMGNTRYTSEQIISYVDSPLLSNSVLAMLFHKQLEKQDLSFVESLELERLDRQTLRIHVNEKQIVGYVVQENQKLYFDSEGMVLDAIEMTEEEIALRQAEEAEYEKMKATEQSLAASAKDSGEDGADPEDVTSEDGNPDSADGTSGDNNADSENEPEAQEEESEVQPEEPETLQAEEVKTGNENATAFHAAVTDVPEILGITTEPASVGKEIATGNENIFYTVLSIARMVEKLEILPEKVFFDEEWNITLVYNEGMIHCALGQDTFLEEKITRVASILPDLEGNIGVLHLEDYTTDTINVIFSKESLYSLKKELYS